MWWYLRAVFDHAPNAVESWLDTEERSWAGRVCGGIVVPVGLALVAWVVFSSGKAWYPGRVWVELHGRGAMAVGIALIGAGVFCHGHYFWAPVYRLEIISQLLKFIGAAACAGGMIYVLWALVWEV